MAKRRKPVPDRKIVTSGRPGEAKRRKLPVYTRQAYVASIATILAGLVAQAAIAALVFRHLPARIPANWIGVGSATQTMPSWIVFVAFPGAQLILLMVGIYSPKDQEGRKVMEWGKAVSLIALTLLFTALQGSAFTL